MENILNNHLKIKEVNSISELLGGDMNKCRPYFIHESYGHISLDYYDREKDDELNSDENRVLTLYYQAPYKTDNDIERIGRIESKMNLLVDIVNELHLLDKLRWI